MTARKTDKTEATTTALTEAEEATLKRLQAQKRAAKKQGGPCGCGCGGTTKGGRVFLQGHDAKLCSAFLTWGRGKGSGESVDAALTEGSVVAKAVAGSEYLTGKLRKAHTLREAYDRKVAEEAAKRAEAAEKEGTEKAA
jgi:translation initiation factor 1 (eIF-1/SUI1)